MMSQRKIYFKTDIGKELETIKKEVGEREFLKLPTLGSRLEW